MRLSQTFSLSVVRSCLVDWQTFRGVMFGHSCKWVLGRVVSKDLLRCMGLQPLCPMQPTITIAHHIANTKMKKGVLTTSVSEKWSTPHSSHLSCLSELFGDSCHTNLQAFGLSFGKEHKSPLQYCYGVTKLQTVVLPPPFIHHVY